MATGRNVTVYLSNGTIVCGGYARRGIDENFIIFPNDNCTIEPVNSKKKKHRGRKCTVTGKSNKHGAIQVKFEDTNSYGYVDPADLVPEKRTTSEAWEISKLTIFNSLSRLHNKLNSNLE